IWVNGDQIAELREHKANLRHGVERWGHPLLPYEEGHFLRGKRAGIFRRWTGSALEKGYPQYFVDDKRVSRDEYLRARKANPELPAYRRKDDSRERPMHPGLLKVWLRKEIRANLMRTPQPEERIGCGAP